MSDRLNLSIVTNDLMIGGVQRNIVAFLRQLDRSRFNPSVCCVCAGGELAAAVRELDVPLEVFRGVWSDPFTASVKYPAPFIFRQVTDFYRRHNTHIAQTRLFLGNWYGRVAARRAGVPVVVAAEHSTYTHKNFLHRMIDRRQARYCRRIVTVSQTVKRFTLQQTGLSPSLLTCIYNGIDLARFDGVSRRAEVRQEFQVPEGDLLLGSCARLIEDKNYQGWFQVFKHLLGHYPKLRFLLIGDGPYLPELRRRAQALEVQDRVHFAGQREDVPRLLSGLDLFILPSQREGLPTVVLEAMAMRVPVLGNAIPQIEELINHGLTGYICNFDDRQRAADETLKILANPKALAACGSRGHALVKAKFTIQRMVRDYCNLYEELWQEHLAGTAAAGFADHATSASTVSH